MHVCAGTALWPAHVPMLYPHRHVCDSLIDALQPGINMADLVIGPSWSAHVCAAKGEVGLVSANAWQKGVAAVQYSDI